MRCNKCLGSCIVVQSKTSFNHTIRTYLCKRCRHTFKTTETKDISYRSDNRDYTPTCPKGYDGCTNDPAYIRYNYPETYIRQFGYMTPEEASKKCCHNKNSGYCICPE